MINFNYRCHEESLKHLIAKPNDDFNRIAGNLCLQALDHARAQLHPLLGNVELNRLNNRCEFIQTFKLTLEQGITERLVAWQPCIQAVFKFDSPRKIKTNCWDSSIHLLVLVSQPLNAMRTLTQRLDQSLIRHLKLLHWSRFQTRQSILKVHQVTPDEVRRGVSYGALFDSVYTTPVKVWPQHGMEG